MLKILFVIFKAIPSLKSWWDSLVTAYLTHKYAEMKKENRDAISKAFETQDQRPLEEALGSSHPGQHSIVIGSDVVDSLPGVQNRNKK